MVDADSEVRPPLSAEDRRLLERVAPSARALDLSDEGLRVMAAAEGVDFATAALYLHLRSDSRRAAFFQRVESAAPPARPGETPRILIMPGAFAAEYPHTGADGATVIELAEKLGWVAERVPVPSLAPMAENAASLVELLRRHSARSTILVSLSKGGADVRAALERPHAATELRDVRAWINLSGIILGTPLVAWLRARPLRCFGARILLRLRRQRFAVVDELGRGPTSRLARPLVLPSGMRVIHVAGFPLERHLSGAWARRGHARLSAMGPNDGGGILLGDVARLSGDIYPVWAADHYLKPVSWDIRPLLLRILLEAAL
jgi:hypothetical protein